MSSVPCMRSACFSISAPIMYLGESRSSPLNAQGEFFSVVGRQFVFGAAAVSANLVAYAANRSNEGAVVSGIHLGMPSGPAIRWQFLAAGAQAWRGSSRRQRARQ